MPGVVKAQEGPTFGDGPIFKMDRLGALHVRLQGHPRKTTVGPGPSVFS